MRVKGATGGKRAVRLEEFLISRSALPLATAIAHMRQQKMQQGREAVDGETEVSAGSRGYAGTPLAEPVPSDSPPAAADKALDDDALGELCEVTLAKTAAQWAPWRAHSRQGMSGSRIPSPSSRRG